MKTVYPHEIRPLLVDIFQAAGTPSDIAQCVADSLVDASLKGVDSHGIMRVTKYVNEILSGYMKPAARPVIVKETPSIAILQGGAGFGIYALGQAMQIAIRKAKANGTAAVGVTEVTHTGRLGQFVEKAVEDNVIAFVMGGGAYRIPGWVTPYGGAKRLMAPNPWAIGLPGGSFGPVVVDISTSATAEGKLQVYRAKHEQLPPGWILDKNGKPSTNVEDFYNGGFILPFGGHKGYGLSVVAEMLCDALLGMPLPKDMNWFIFAIDIAVFRAVQEFQQAAEAFLSEVKASPPAEGFQEVMIPGEVERHSAQNREITGIPIPDETLQKIQETARQVGIDVKL
jgi:LDH2 family malate/lactate/ureidoglycolate dehydrogenase